MALRMARHTACRMPGIAADATMASACSSTPWIELASCWMWLTERIRRTKISSWGMLDLNRSYTSLMWHFLLKKSYGMRLVISGVAGTSSIWIHLHLSSCSISVAWNLPWQAAMTSVLGALVPSTTSFSMISWRVSMSASGESGPASSRRLSTVNERVVTISSVWMLLT